MWEDAPKVWPTKSQSADLEHVAFALDGGLSLEEGGPGQRNATTNTVPISKDETKRDETRRDQILPYAMFISHILQPRNTSLSGHAPDPTSLGLIT